MGLEELVIVGFNSVVLVRELPQHGLRRGDRGIVVEIYEPDGLEVEFVAAAGTTHALLALTLDDVCSIADWGPQSSRPVDRPR
ncbi:MAG: DUF4926 domain-containing protein [Planctomycetes bacterium]|nr:DUF4926 domain-containing protein [Planctomycetota bacterium]